MKDNNIIKLCLLFSVIGLVSLFLITQFEEVENIPIGKIDESHMGQMVKVNGEVTDKYVSKDGHLFFDLTENGNNIKIVLFNNKLNDLGLKPEEIKGKIEIIGIVKKYKGEMEILPEKIGLQGL